MPNPGDELTTGRGDPPDASCLSTQTVTVFQGRERAPSFESVSRLDSSRSENG